MIYVGNEVSIVVSEDENDFCVVVVVEEVLRKTFLGVRSVYVIDPMVFRTQQRSITDTRRHRGQSDTRQPGPE